ncbi:serine protease [Labrenzia sp. OB1]|uniref:trypsin-like serine peptidase n=1 Tax=Labrenzia sp. OB1 TaxID=1561204 RepID=UPI0007B22986|nr:serine protease [Labrenzia sp. OB1]KZM48972.1 hypothetical protein OA90_17415 [Labrenzia sp. OB1]
MSNEGFDFEKSPKRIRRLFSSGGAGGEGGGQESTGGGSSPGQQDISAIARRLLGASAGRSRMSKIEAEGVARSIVATAQKGLESIDGGPAGALSFEETVALEAVIHVRGRPAVRVLGDELEDIRHYPDADMWVMLADKHRAKLQKTTSAASAVWVRDTLLQSFSWVQGTAFLIKPDLALTNRHVLFPPAGTRLARRVPGTTQARLKREYEVLLDFAFDDGAPRQAKYRITDIPFVAEDSDPVDAAVLKVEPVSGFAPDPLPVTQKDVYEIDRLYIVGHPGKLKYVPENIQLVFGDPDERKRVSFGKLMDPVVEGQQNIVHDASTTGGFSGSALHGFMDQAVYGLHYWGDQVAGNRAISAKALRQHPVLGALL